MSSCLYYIMNDGGMLAGVLSAFPLVPRIPPCQCKSESQMKPLHFDS